MFMPTIVFAKLWDCSVTSISFFSHGDIGYTMPSFLMYRS